MGDEAEEGEMRRGKRVEIGKIDKEEKRRANERDDETRKEGVRWR